MSLFVDTIEPYKGTEHLNLSMSYEETKAFLKTEGVKYSIEVWDNKNCNPPIPWKIIRVNNEISLFFAEESMFKICFKEGYFGGLPNGIKIGMPMEEAQKIDGTLTYDDDEEDYQSDNGYWIEDDLDLNSVSMITIFIPEIIDEEEFFSYNWMKK